MILWDVGAYIYHKILRWAMLQDENSSTTTRRSVIGKILQERKEVAISELAERFRVSEMTIRRDLDKLAKSGRVRRTHGGAVSAERMISEFDFFTQRQTNSQAKRAIATEAVKLIRPGTRLIIGAGTTTLELACLLKDLKDLIVITPSLAVASVLQFSEGIQTILLGGEIYKERAMLTGIVTETVLDMFAVNIAFQGADGVTLDGAMYANDMRTGRVDQKIRDRAEQTYLLADHSKIGKMGFMQYGFVQQNNALITDNGIRDEDKCRLEKLGIKVIVALS